MGDAIRREPGQAELDGVNGQRRCDKVRSAAAGPREHEFCTGRDEYRAELQRHGIGCREHLQLPGPGNECREEPERILRRGECGDRFAYDRSSQIALNKDGSWRKSLKSVSLFGVLWTTNDGFEIVASSEVIRAALDRKVRQRW